MHKEFIDACQDGNVEFVRMSLANSNLHSDYNSLCLQIAAEKGHSEIVKILLTDSRFDPVTGGNYAIKMASFNGHFEIVKILCLWYYEHGYDIKYLIDVMTFNGNKFDINELCEYYKNLDTDIIKFSGRN